MERRGLESVQGSLWRKKRSLDPDLTWSHGYRGHRRPVRLRAHGGVRVVGHHSSAGRRCGALTALAATQSGRAQWPSPGGQSQVRNRPTSKERKNKRWNFEQKMCKCVYLFAAVPADSSSELNASPQLVPLLEEAGKLLPPVLAQCPWKNLILTLLLILLHGVGKIPRDGAHEPHLDMREDTRSIFFSLWDLQCNE